MHYSKQDTAHVIIKALEDYTRKVTKTQATAREALVALGTHNEDVTLTKEYCGVYTQVSKKYVDQVGMHTFNNLEKNNWLGISG